MLGEINLPRCVMLEDKVKHIMMISTDGCIENYSQHSIQLSICSCEAGGNNKDFFWTDCTLHVSHWPYLPPTTTTVGLRSTAPEATPSRLGGTHSRASQRGWGEQANVDKYIDGWRVGWIKKIGIPCCLIIFAKLYRNIYQYMYPYICIWNVHNCLCACPT